MGKGKDGNVTCFMYTQMRIVGLVLQRWIGAPDFPSESAGTGLTSLKRKRWAFENAYCSMPFACASGLLQVASYFTGIVCILEGD